MYKIFMSVLVSFSLLFSACSKSVKPSENEKTVEQKIWHDEYHEKVTVTTDNEHSNVVSTVSTKQQSVNLQEMDKLTEERLDAELAKRQKEEMEFLTTTEKVTKVLVAVGVVVGAVAGAFVSAALQAQSR
ncbi:MAG: hypothetical protein H8E76_03040 [Helicobacteraceae bacterium]|nr:hypothetical protein [Candidatus Sulfurimonas ponti]